eukprot:m.201820 g.201820  ORF g.201820 m.201820 type:complete len:56 (-) comp10683_c0_seq10:898-1065(-)
MPKRVHEPMGLETVSDLPLPTHSRVVYCPEMLLLTLENTIKRGNLAHALVKKDLL